MIYKFFDQKTSNTNKGTGSNSENKELAKEPHNPITTKFIKQKVHSSFIDNIWDANLADMQFIKRFLLLIFTVNMHGFFQ